jgi:hypothetical protein
MRRLAIILSLLFVVSDASAKKKPINTGDPLPKKAIKNKQCHDKGAVRLIGSDPSTPFAVVNTKGDIDSAGDACCGQWARKGTHWKSVDAYGQIVGDTIISGGEGYDVTQCYELSFDTKKGKPGVGLYLDGPYKQPKSVAWTPSDNERASLSKLVATLEHSMVPTAPYTCTPEKPLPFAERSLFFTVDKERWAVVGGSMLTIARLQDDGRWIAKETDATTSNTCMPRAFLPRAVFDINADGQPEIFVHQDFGDCFGDIALGLSANRWLEVAAAVHGSTA